MPRKGHKIFFWKTPSPEPVAPETADALRTAEINLHRFRLEFEFLADLVRHTSCQVALEKGHASLSRLLSALEEQDAELSAIRSELAAQPVRKLAGWRITEREILGSEALGLKSDLDALFQEVRRAHVDLTGALLELR